MTFNFSPPRGQRPEVLEIVVRLHIRLARQTSASFSVIFPAVTLHCDDTRRVIARLYKSSMSVFLCVKNWLYSVLTDFVYLYAKASEYLATY